MNPAFDLINIVERSQAGDSDSFEELVTRFQHMAYGYAYAFLDNFQLAEDVAQEAFIEAYQNLHQLRIPQAFPSWFKRIIYKHCDRLVRKKDLTMVALNDLENIPNQQMEIDEIHEERTFQNQVLSIVKSLPEKQRTVTVLFYLGGSTYLEIAEFLGLTEKTVKSRLHSARNILRGRILAMAKEEFENNSLPDMFTQETVGRAVDQAAALNKAHKYDSAEKLLRQILDQLPDYPPALKELNRALMWGQVYEHGKWELLGEIGLQAQRMLTQLDDDQVRDDLACTLLAIPKFPEAIQLIETWVERQGPSLRRLGMLSWAYAASGNHRHAFSIWKEITGNPHISLSGEVGQLADICRSLVDAFTAAQDEERAQLIAQEGWRLRSRFSTGNEILSVDNKTWLEVFLRSGLDLSGPAQHLLGLQRIGDASQDAALRISVRAYYDPLNLVLPDWLAWVEEKVHTEDWESLNKARLHVLSPLRLRGEVDSYNQFAQSTVDRLMEKQERVAKHVLDMWDNERYNYFPYIDVGDWESVELLSWQAVEAGNYEMGSTGLIMAAAALGKPNPGLLVDLAVKDGVAKIDPYGLCGWYMLAREAAAKGDRDKALENLDRSLSYWSNPPYHFDALWLKDLYWGDLRDSIAFQQLFAEKERRIGPVFGMLHYFPSW